MQIDVNRLKGKTVELGLTGAAVAEKLGIDPVSYTHLTLPTIA